MLQHEQVFTRSAVAKQSLEASKNIFQEKILFDTCKENTQRREKFFWTRNQRELIEGDPKRVLFTSNYGTGKTLVMTAKAMQLGRKRQLFYFSKRQADCGNQINSKETFKEVTAMHLRRKELYYLQNQTNLEKLTKSGKTFIVLFTNPDALLFHLIHKEFEELKDHVEVVCCKG
jgi:hypothetical protein